MQNLLTKNPKSTKLSSINLQSENPQSSRSIASCLTTHANVATATATATATLNPTQHDRRAHYFGSVMASPLHKMPNLARAVLTASLVFTGSSALSVNVLAADCKGQNQAQCGTLQSCSWVDTYKRKDGRTVNGFCRVKGKLNKPKPAKPAKAGA